jgi:hypothetical protein
MLGGTVYGLYRLVSYTKDDGQFEGDIAEKGASIGGAMFIICIILLFMAIPEYLIYRNCVAPSINGSEGDPSFGLRERLAGFLGRSSTTRRINNSVPSARERRMASQQNAAPVDVPHNEIEHVDGATPYMSLNG